MAAPREFLNLKYLFSTFKAMIVAESLHDRREIEGLCSKLFSANIMSYLEIIPLFYHKEFASKP